MGEVVASANELRDLQKYDEKAFADVSSAGEWLPRLQLMTSNSEVCKDGSFPTNHYAFIKGKNTLDLGKTVDVIPLAWRPKALDMGETVIASFDQDSDEFKRIAQKSNLPNSGCMYGPDFLVWIPQIQEYASFYMGSKSARNESPNLLARFKEDKPATLGSQFLNPKKSTFSWWCPQVLSCQQEYARPDVETAREQIIKFNNPPESAVETAAPATEGQRAV